MNILLLVPLVVLLGACTSSTVLQEQSKELKVLGDYPKAERERAYTRSQVVLHMATSARDSTVVAEAPSKLGLDRAKEELLTVIQ